jgi:hypothetical protein
VKEERGRKYLLPDDYSPEMRRKIQFWLITLLWSGLLILEAVLRALSTS